MAEIPDFVAPNVRLHCLHCGVTAVVKTAENWNIRLQDNMDAVREDGGNSRGIDLHWGACPACGKFIIDLVWWDCDPSEAIENAAVRKVERAYPIFPGLSPVPPEVPDDIAAEYAEARKVAAISPLASAALCRRCLQHALRRQGFVHKSGKLYQEIQLAQQDPRATSMLVEKLKMVQSVGNYAAHPNANDQGEILEVHPGELQALFGALDDFFDVFYVKPERHEKVKAEINEKLQSAHMKTI